MALSSYTKYVWLPIILCGILLDARSLGNSYLYRINPETDFYDQLQELIEENDFQKELARKNWPQSIKIVNNWPKKDLDENIKQVNGIDVYNGEVHVFHRGDRVWDANSFNSKNVYMPKNDGPIKNDTIHVYNASSGELIRTWGKKRFYMPHGITIDKHGNTWITDVGLHQVFKFNAGFDEPNITLGEALVPGQDEKHFCKPTDIAVASSGEFFVSDGYCNSRIMKFNSEGKFELVFGTLDWLSVPHGMALDEINDQLYIADRENYRVVCYTAGLNGRRSGVNLFTISKPYMGRVFGLAQFDDNLFAITGSGDEDKAPANALVQIKIDKKQLVKTWRPSEIGFLMPHDIAYDSNQSVLYIVDGSADATQKIYKLKLT